MVRIETPRLILRPPEEKDIMPLNQAINNSLAELQPWQPWANDPSMESTRGFVKYSLTEWQSQNQKDFPLIIVNKHDNKIIGASGYNDKSDTSVPYYEIGYWIETRYTGQGFASEAVNALTRYAFLKLQAARVQIRVQRGNVKSISVAEKCGYLHEASLKNAMLDNTTQNAADAYIFACLDLSNIPKLKASW